MLYLTVQNESWDKSSQIFVIEVLNSRCCRQTKIEDTMKYIRYGKIHHSSSEPAIFEDDPLALPNFFLLLKLFTWKIHTLYAPHFASKSPPNVNYLAHWWVVSINNLQSLMSFCSSSNDKVNWMRRRWRDYFFCLPCRLPENKLSMKSYKTWIRLWWADWKS